MGRMAAAGACALALALSGCGIADSVRNEISTAPVANTISPAPVTSSGSGEHSLTLRATAQGKASASFSSPSQETIMDDMPQAWTHHLRTNAPDEQWALTVMAEELTGGAELSCEIVGPDGNVLAREQGKGVVTCFTPQPA